MSLRAFHIVFIAVSVMLSAFVAAWAASEYRAVHDSGYIIACVASAATGVGLAVYGAMFQRKTKGLS
jgi:NADH:ubiquinone oxidoreductase subunit K